MRTVLVLTAGAGLAGLLGGCSNSPETAPTSPTPSSTSSGPKAPLPTATSNPDFDSGLPSSCTPDPSGFYSFSAQNLAGTETVPLCRYKGKVVMVVNVASKCGNTPQYTPLQSFYEKYRDKGFFVLAFPCNQFGGQEPGGATEITKCLTQYKVTFPVFEKITVNTEAAATEHPLYTWLKGQPGGAGKIEWNFVKFLIDRDGKLVKRWADDVLNSSTDIPGVEQTIAETVNK